MLEFLRKIDKNTVFFFQNHPFPFWITRFFQLITTLWDYGAIWWIVSILFLCLGWWEFFMIGIRLLIGIFGIIFIWEFLLKHIFRRKRPFVKYKNINSIAFHTPSSFSFPSGHTSMAFVVLVILWNFLNIYYLILLIFIVFSIAFSRLFLRVHYFSDVLFWMIFGVLVWFFINSII